MNIFTKFTTFPILLAFTCYVSANGDDCNNKRQRIEQQIVQAKTSKNIYQITGLERALAGLTSNCSLDDLIKSAEQKTIEKQLKVAKKQTEVNYAESNLTHALTNNDEKKIVKYEERVSEKQQELEELQEQAEELRAELDALKNSD